MATQPFRYLALDWIPHGYFPEQFYGVPHFDFHFYTLDPAVVRGITGVGEDLARLMKHPEAQYIAEGYVPAEPAVVNMGLHWIRMDFPEFHGKPFTHSPIYGTYDGKLAFIEPMITRAFLLSHPSVDQPIHQPQAWAQSGVYPTRYAIKHDAARKLYSVALEGMTYREGK